MLRLPKTIAPETTKAQYSPKVNQVNRISHKPTSVKRSNHRQTLSDNPKVSVAFHSKPFKATLKMGKSRETTKMPLSSLVSPKVRQAAITSRPKTFGMSDQSEHTLRQHPSESVSKPKYSDSGISTEQLLQSYSCRSNEQYEELLEI